MKITDNTSSNQLTLKDVKPGDVFRFNKSDNYTYLAMTPCSLILETGGSVHMLLLETCHATYSTALTLPITILESTLTIS